MISENIDPNCCTHTQDMKSFPTNLFSEGEISLLPTISISFPFMLALMDLIFLKNKFSCYFVQQRQEVPPNFKRALSSRLRRLVQQDKIEKVILFFVTLC